MQKIQCKINAIIEALIKSIEKGEPKEKIQKLISVISENSAILDNKCPENVEILRGEDELEGELDIVCE